MSKLNQTVFLIEADAVVERKLSDLMDLVPTTSRPDGIGTKDYARENDDGAGVYTWATWGGPERLMSQHVTIDEAVARVEDIWIGEIFGSTEVAVYATAEAANAALADMLAD